MNPFARQGRYARPDMLVSGDQLQRLLADRSLRIVDLRSADAYAQGHLPGAVRFDEAALRNPSDVETYLPDPKAFETAMRGLGIGPRTTVVAYDDIGGRGATRLWYCLAVYGHERFRLLDGGWKRWEAERRPTTTETPTVAPGSLRVSRRPGPMSCPTAQVLARRPGVVVLDARSDDEYTGKRAASNGKGGHLPGAVRVEWTENLEPETGLFRSADDLKALYVSRGVTPDREVVTYCQSGGRASLSLFALRLLGYPKVRLYYGSFADYTGRDAPLDR